MNFNQLAYFVEAVNCGSISKASDKLFITQPALTLSLQSLEKELGVKLYKKSNKGISCTEKGESFYQDALAILEMQKKWLMWTDKTASQAKSYINMFVINAIYYTVFPDFLLEFSKKYPDIVINISFGTISDLEKQIKQGESNIFIVSGQDQSYQETQFGEKYEEEYLFADTPQVYISKDHHLAGKDFIEEKELTQCLEVYYGDKNLLYDYLGRNIHDLENIMFLNHQDHIFRAILSNNGYSVAPSFMKQKYHNQEIMKDIVTIPLKENNRRVKFFLVYSKDVHRKKAESILVGEVRKFFRSCFADMKIDLKEDGTKNT